MSSNRVLVTGGAGFIGSHVVERCLREGYSVTVLDNLSQGKKQWVSADAKFVEGDILDLDLLRDLTHQVDGVFHLAAMSRVLPSVGKGPESALYSADQNIRGTLNVLVASAENKVEKVIYSASSTYYGTRPAPHYEDGDFGGSTPYAVSKYVGELYCAQFSRMFGLSTVCLRYFQVYGKRCPSTGEYAMVSSIFVNQAKRGQPLTIDGDGSQRRDFVHVDDVAEANLRAFHAFMAKDGVVINVGRGQSHSVKELADLISPNQVHRAPRAFDMQETLADTTRCSAILGWTPTVPFREGTLRLINEMTECPECKSIGDCRERYLAADPCTRADCPLNA